MGGCQPAAARAAARARAGGGGGAARARHARPARAAPRGRGGLAARRRGGQAGGRGVEDERGGVVARAAARTDGADDDATSGQKSAGGGIEISPKLLTVLVPALGLGLLLAAALGFKEQLVELFGLFTAQLKLMGPWAWPAYTLAYFALEVCLVPAIPLTMSAGLVLGVGPGVAAVAVGNVMAATTAFLIARTFLRDKVRALAEKSARFGAIDRAVGREGFKVVALLRLSPLLPQANCNYLYGVTSIKLRDYAAATFVGCLPTSFLYVNAGHLGRTLVEGASEGGALGGSTWIIGLGVLFTAVATTYVVRLADAALKAELDDPKAGTPSAE